MRPESFTNLALTNRLYSGEQKAFPVLHAADTFKGPWFPNIVIGLKVVVEYFPFAL